MSYGPSPEDAHRQVGIYTGSILKGAKPSELPVMQAVKLEMIINIKTAKALGIVVPPTRWSNNSCFVASAHGRLWVLNVRFDAAFGGRADVRRTRRKRRF
jgi:hypothetical protein